MQGCYLLHFYRPIYRAQHYLGWSVNIARRVAQHQRGKGARLVAQALTAGIGVDLVRVWPEVDKVKERALKRLGPKGQCPKCRSQRTRKKSGATKREARALRTRISSFKASDRALMEAGAS